MSPSMQKSPSLLDLFCWYLLLSSQPFGAYLFIRKGPWNAGLRFFPFGSPQCLPNHHLNEPSLSFLSSRWHLSPRKNPPTHRTVGACALILEKSLLSQLSKPPPQSTPEIYAFLHVKKNSVIFFRWRWQILKAPSQKKSRRVVVVEFPFLHFSGMSYSIHVCILFKNIYIECTLHSLQNAYIFKEYSYVR